MKALILAAGLGTRLKPFTNHQPKALFPVDGITLLEHSIDHLRKYGISDIIINVHHFAGHIIDYLRRNNNFGMAVSISDESGELLDTGGGLKNAAGYFTDNQPFLIHNVDVISDLDLRKLMEHHLATGGMATLVVRDRETSRYFLFNETLQLCGWENKKTGETKITRTKQKIINSLAFSGIQVVDPGIFNHITETGKFSLTEMYLRLSEHQKITGYIDNASFWKDMGS
jgi:NDP-sugar pyrophosphorylase family protein